MKRGTNRSPDVDLAPSHQIARCTVCACILNFTTDGNGRVLESCPHCDWGWPLDTGARAQRHPVAPTTPGRDTTTAAEYGRIGGRWRKNAKAFTPEDAIRALTDFYLAHGRAPTQREMGAHGREFRLAGVPTLRGLQKWFGSSQSAFRLAGIPEEGIPQRGYHSQLRHRIPMRVAR